MNEREMDVHAAACAAARQPEIAQHGAFSVPICHAV